MKSKVQNRRAFSPEPSGAADDCGRSAVPATETVASSHLDFRSAEFNNIDDLDDNADNYRVFRSLEGIVTADMRHHEARKRVKPSNREAVAAHAASHVLESGNEEVAAEGDVLPVTIVSKGRTLIIDTDPERAVRCGERLRKQGMACTLWVTGSDESGIFPSCNGVSSVIKVNSVSVVGGLGGFSATAAFGDGQNGPASLPHIESGSFDLVLDLQPIASFSGKQPPMGYYAPGNDEVRLEEALAELPEMRGRFKKPRFTIFRADRCLHGRSRVRDCQRCLEVCPFEAIKAERRNIAIDPYFCQGCGFCASVCPADAIGLINPSPGELLANLRDLLADRLANTDEAPDLVLYDSMLGEAARQGLAGIIGKDRIFYEVEEIGRIGLEGLLASLAYGAGSVYLICDRQRPATSREALARQVDLGQAILRGLQMPVDRIRLLYSGMGECGEVEGVQGAVPVTRPAIFAPDLDRRTLIRLAVQHLFEVSEGDHPAVPLPEYAPFGTVAIEAESCSLCMACAAVCPAGALSAGGDTPRLTFVESLCHQCGMCALACPEDAVRLQPRLLCNAGAADTPTVLREVEPFSCVECGVPFASQAMVSRLEEKLAGHWMYGSERQLRRLRMCRTCRTRDALLAQDLRL